MHFLSKAQKPNSRALQAPLNLLSLNPRIVHSQGSKPEVFTSLEDPKAQHLAFLHVVVVPRAQNLLLLHVVLDPRAQNHKVLHVFGVPGAQNLVLLRVSGSPTAKPRISTNVRAPGAQGIAFRSSHGSKPRVFTCFRGS